MGGDRRVAVTGATTGIGDQRSEELTVRGSWLGVKLDGTNGSGANTGIWLDPGSDEATIGGTEASQRNVVVNSAAEGLDIEGRARRRCSATTSASSPTAKLRRPTARTSRSPTRSPSKRSKTMSARPSAPARPPCDGGCNVISGATFAGIDLHGNGGNEEPATGPTIVHGNYIGLSADGTETVANASYGVYVGKATNALIGGPENADANFIAGGSEGIAAENAKGFEAIGNMIGSGAAGAEITAPGTGVVRNQHRQREPGRGLRKRLRNGRGRRGRSALRRHRNRQQLHRRGRIRRLDQSRPERGGRQPDQRQRDRRIPGQRHLDRGRPERSARQRGLPVGRSGDPARTPGCFSSSRPKT